MSEYLVLNDASLPFSSSSDCERNLEEFFSIVHRANSNGVSFYRADDLEGNWSSLVYADDFEFGAWLNDSLNMDQYRLIKSVLGNIKCPLILVENTEHEKAIKDMLFMLLSDHDIEVKALGVASIINAHAISFASHANWQVDSVSILQEWDEGGAVKQKAVNVPNVCSLPHIDEVIENLVARKKTNKNYLTSLSVDENDDFPNLIFCESALKNLSSASVTTIDFPRIIEVLSKLNDAISESSNLSQLVNKTALDITGESAVTMATPKHARKRKFKHPTLGSTTFEDHVKNFPGEKRMHILTDYTNNRICIGYFGRHLSNVSNPT